MSDDRSTIYAREAGAKNLLGRSVAIRGVTFYVQDAANGGHDVCLRGHGLRNLDRSEAYELANRLNDAIQPILTAYADDGRRRAVDLLTKPPIEGENVE